MDKKGLRLIITGATGMVGEGVLHVCLQHPDVEAVLIINRKPLGLSHPRLKEIIHADFFDLSPIARELTPYDACLFCLGISSVGVRSDAYFKTTYTLTLHMAETLLKVNRDISFCYVSGAGTDRTGKGRVAWARVKGKTENDLMKLPFRSVFALRPGFIKPIRGLKHAHKFYRYINWMFPAGRRLFPGGFCTMEELAHAMLHAVKSGDVRKVVDGKEIIRLAAEERKEKGLQPTQ